MKKLWEPTIDRSTSSNLSGFMAQAGISDFSKLYDWSIKDPKPFWGLVWNYCEVKHSKPYEQVLESAQMPGAKWFTGSKLNFAENLLKHRSEKTAIIFRGENNLRKTFKYSELYTAVAKVASTLKDWGLKPGDRVAGIVPNIPEAIIAMLAVTSLGGIWSSCSPDFGIDAAVDRFGQIEPRFLFATNSYSFKGKEIDCREKTIEIVNAIPSLERLIVIPFLGELPIQHPKGISLTELYKSSATEITFEQLDFNHPLYVLFSSGTTGKPKCIVHSAGGTLIEHLKELVLHTNLKSSDTIFYQTTCGWMMWNWLVSALATGATLVLYDGFPLEVDGKILFDIADQERISIFGTNAKYLSLIEKLGLTPVRTHRLQELHTILSTGSVLSPENFDYVYSQIKSDLCLSSISGGTDIVGCFALGCPILPVYRGELQTRSLGYAVEVFDESGKALIGKKGELVCTKPFPSMPVGFWNDPEQRKFKSSYFERFPGVWHHGDYVELCANGGMVFHGRSDAVLNPGGVRIGTAEIYRQVEAMSEILEAIAIGQDWHGDVRVVLFVRLKDNIVLDDELKKRIKEQIRKNASPFHVPAKIISVPDIPRTKSGKIVELAVRDIVNGLNPKNLDALLNPEALQHFADLAELRE